MYRFDEFRVEPDSLRVFRDERRLDAPPQVVQVLVHLLENRHRVVTRRELVDGYWPRAGTGADAALNTCIRRIRALLGDDADLPRFVQTRPRSGYRFVGTVLVEPAAPGRPRGMLAVAAASLAAILAGVAWAQGGLLAFERRSIALEPAENLCEYTLFPKFNAGLRESLAARMTSRLPEGFALVEPESEADFRLRTAVRQTPRSTLVSVSLVRSRDGVTILSAEFAEPTNMKDYVPVQRTLADRMAASASRALSMAR